MITVYVLNGPNLNLLGQREPHIYGSTTLAEIEQRCQQRAAELGVALVFRQSNHEGVLVDWIHEARDQAAGVIINAGAYTHTSIALLDALNSVAVPVIELHVSNLHRREPFRHRSYVAQAATGVIAGFGAAGYELALQAVVTLVAERAAD